MTHAPAAIELRAGALRLALRPDLGGSVAGLWHGETPVLRSTEPDALAVSRASAMYPLVPYSNRLGDRRFRWGGHDYTTAANVSDSPHSLHGLGWQRPWQPVSSTATESVIELEHEPDADWPFAFTARQHFALTPQSFSVRMQLVNRAAVEQPAGVGWHPYFPKRARSHLQIAFSERWDSDASELPVRKVAQDGVDSTLSQLDYDNCFEGWRGPARLLDERFSLQLTSSLGYLVVYTPRAKPYFCVEPVSHVSNAIRMADPVAHGIVALAPGATLEATLGLDIDLA